ncbi:FAD:protein FMN transferase [Microbacterium sp. SORGH_AS_0888]|uniref:FAD:protein FMN transferase n=1 Tax=Microbacterium sp. SORGH_AS_0888 TaxID=3041791 RepID=UPI0027852DEB|nr:FAD:protein FMN transferase [Microbacterium sp. SORGH_AS_0888]MDQ1128057.1 thiamine biosynthesis lipoprotein [Microbacterium sp. SORGH_AS_0888]
MTARWAFEAIGTRWEIETDQTLAPEPRERVRTLIESFDREWSRFRDDSLVARLARDGGDAPAPRDAAAMFARYDDLDAATAGAVNPLVGASLARRGYDAASSLVDRGAEPAPAWLGLLSPDGSTLTAEPGTLIDVGALGKGRLVDLVLAELAPDVEGTLVVDASGDLAVRGGPVRIGLEHPYDASRAIGVWEVTDGALCASAVNRRVWGDGLHHVLDARTGEPVRTYAATWARAAEAMTADAAATALFFDGGPELAHRWGVEWARMRTDGVLEWSAGAREGLFL